MTMGAIIAIIMLVGPFAAAGRPARLPRSPAASRPSRHSTSLQRMMEADDERQVAMRSIVPEIRTGHIELRDLSFRYPNAGARFA